MTSYDRDVIRPYALGRFRDLLGATAKHPAMLFYLDNWMSSKPGAPEGLLARPAAQGNRGRFSGLNENYAREMMELHTLGVDGGYTQKDVTGVARCFTGWSIERPEQGGGFVFRARMHDPGEKVVLTSPEFFSDQAYRAKVKKPLELVASAVRALGHDVRVWPHRAGEWKSWHGPRARERHVRAGWAREGQESVRAMARTAARTTF